MRLTKEQVEYARTWNLDCEFAVGDCPVSMACLAALDAYQRVEALLAQITPAQGGTIDWCYPPIHELLRRALYGEE